MNEIDYNYLTIIKDHKELFTKDKHNDVYYSDIFHMAIGNKRTLQEAIERFCKSDKDRNNAKKQLEEHSTDECLTANFDKNGRCIILPLAVAFGIREIEQQIRANSKRMNDKYISGTVEAQYDNYLSVEEAADLHEAKSVSMDIEKEQSYE